jgi:hypothetical protein
MHIEISRDHLISQSHERSWPGNKKYLEGPRKQIGKVVTAN